MELAPEIEEIRKKYKVRRDRLGKFLASLDESSTIEEIIAAIEVKYGNKVEKVSGLPERNETDSIIRDTTEVGSAIPTEDEDHTDEIPSGRVSEVVDAGKFSEKLNVSVETQNLKKHYCPVSGKEV